MSSFIDFQGMHDRFKAKRDMYLATNSPRAAFQMEVLMKWALENGAKA
jgi:hypothetical protein